MVIDHLGLSCPVYADPIGFSVDTQSDRLVQIDLGTGATTFIGAGIGFDRVQGLAFQPSTGILFGVDQESDQLFTVDITTGVGTAVGAFGVDVGDVGLAFGAGGTLFMSSDKNGTYIVDPTTGTATLLADPNTINGTKALAFDGSTLFGVGDTCKPLAVNNCLMTVDQTTGATHVIGSLGLSDKVEKGGLDFDCNGTLWHIEEHFDTVFTIDTTTGMATAGAKIACKPGCKLIPLAIQASATNSLPVPSSFVIFSIGLAAMRLICKRGSVLT